jgi:hypothetical protein
MGSRGRSLQKLAGPPLDANCGHFNHEIGEVTV